MVARIGFACKYLHEDQTQKKKILEELQRPLTERSTTVTWLGRQTREVAEERLWDIMIHNAAAAKRLVEYVGSLPAELRMVRIGSNQLPCATHPEWRYFWQRPDVIAYGEKHYGMVGDAARALDVRLSMHPGQFVVLASDNPEIVERSIEEFEYHATLIRWMGYGKKFQDFKCNVHISGRQGPAGIKNAIKRFTPEARNTITIENDENKWGIDDSLELANDLALVLDVHHHWVREGSYIEANDDRIKRIVDSWRGERPAMHYSQSQEQILLPLDTSTRPDRAALMESGIARGKLRAHSDYLPNNALNDYVLSHWHWADIMVEAKCKNLASVMLLQHYYSNNKEKLVA